MTKMTDLNRDLSELLQLARLGRSELLSQESRDIVAAQIESRFADNHSYNQSTEPVKDTESRLRQLVRGNAPWQQISTLLLDRLTKKPNDEEAVRFVELAFIKAPPSEIFKCVEQAFALGLRDFYFQLHLKIRDFIIGNANENTRLLLLSLFHKNYSHLKLTTTEALALVLQLLSAKDKSSAWQYYLNNQNLFEEKWETSKLGVTQDQFFYRLGTIALEMGFVEETRKIFSQIATKAPERNIALAELLQHESSILDRGRHKYITSLEALSAWTDRLESIEGYCRLARSKNGFSDYNRPALNIILKGIIDWVPPTPEAWTALAELIIRNRDLATLLPDTLNLFTSNSENFHNPALDRAIWGEVASLQPRNSKEQFLLGVAKIHLFVHSHGFSETELWQALDWFRRLDDGNLDSMRSSPRAVITAAIAAVDASKWFTKQEKAHKLACLRLSLHGSAAPESVLDQYLEHARDLSAEFVETLAAQAWSQQNVLSFLKISIRYSQVAGLSSNLLGKMWLAANHIENFDLAWRIASIAASRKILSKEIQKTWEISGEKRSAYSCVSLDNIDIDAALEGLPTGHRSILYALCTLATNLAKLAEFSYQASMSGKTLDKGRSPLEQAVFKSAQAGALATNMKKIPIRTGSADLPDFLTTLIHDVDRNPWSYAAKLVLDLLSAPSWNFSLDSLQNVIKSTSLTFQPSSSRNLQSATGRWLSKLPPHERAALSELTTALTGEVEPDFALSLARFAVRLAVMMYPAHSVALNSLQSAHASLQIINDLESFMISPKYSAFRQRKMIYSRVRVPDSLRDASLI